VGEEGQYAGEVSDFAGYVLFLLGTMERNRAYAQGIFGGFITRPPFLPRKKAGKGQDALDSLDSLDVLDYGVIKDMAAVLDKMHEHILDSIKFLLMLEKPDSLGEMEAMLTKFAETVFGKSKDKTVLDALLASGVKLPQ